jgi:phosphoglucomutase
MIKDEDIIFDTEIQEYSRKMAIRGWYEVYYYHTIDKTATKEEIEQIKKIIIKKLKEYSEGGCKKLKYNRIVEEEISFLKGLVFSIDTDRNILISSINERIDQLYTILRKKQ